ncbi:MAG: DUF4277 domain-containing protein, partial [Gammaproteobacteria bacterium]|nr:DUF4277 domain-containing protein [Gammaproteobacteria bacterium]
MVAHIETGTIASSEHYSSKPLKHLGLVAGMYDELGIGELVDRLIVQDGEKRKVSIGQAVNRLGLLCRFGHLDSTGFHTDGQYNSDEQAQEGVIHITQGYSRDH